MFVRISKWKNIVFNCRMSVMVFSSQPLSLNRWLSLVPCYRYYIVLFWVISFGLESQNQVTYIFILGKFKLRCSSCLTGTKKLLCWWALYSKFHKETRWLSFVPCYRYYIVFFWVFSSKLQSVDPNQVTYILPITNSKLRCSYKKPSGQWY